MALFGRPADPLGLEFFNNATNNGANLTAIGDLASTAEYQGRFVGMSNTQIVTSIYQSLYNRAPDVQGLSFFSNALTNGTLNINNIAIAIYDGAQGADLTMRNLKEAAANAFTAAIDTTAEINGYSGKAALAAASAFLAGVTTTAPTPAQITAAVAAATTAVTTGGTFAMTSQLGETINGTAANETINAVLNAANPNSTTGTFNTGDIVNGGGGIDTMNITVTTAGNVLPTGATVSGVEIVNINQSQAAATGITPTAFSGVKELWQIDTTAAGGIFQDVSGVSGDVLVGFRGNGQVVNDFVTTTGNVPTLKIGIDGIASGSTVGPRETVAGSLKSVELSGDTVDNGVLTIRAFATGTESFKGAITSNTTVITDTSTAAARALVQEVDFSGSTGNITHNANVFTNAFVKLAGGSGNDVLTVSNAVANAPTLSVDAGAGNDRITFVNTKSAVAGATSLTGGDGGDTFVLTGGSNLVAANSTAALKASLTTITDFNAAQDTLNISGMVGFGARVAQNVVNAATTGADLLAVTQAVAGVTAAGQHAFFEFGGDTYLFGNIAGAGLQATDALIQLTGVSVASLTSANLIG
jgi:hypothetical protein